MRVLHLTTEFPWPPTSGGLVRTASQLRVLASLPEVEAITVICTTERSLAEVDRQAQAPAAVMPKVRVVPVFHPVHLFDFKRYLWRVALLRAVRGVPYLAAKWDSRTLRRTVEGALAGSHLDLAYVDHLGMARYLPEIRYARPACRVVLDQHNVESSFFQQYAARQTGLRRLVAEAEWRASVRFERATLREADGVVAISYEDARELHRLSGVRAHVVPMVLEHEHTARPRPSGRFAHNLCYVGNLRWHPNVAGLDWFCREVWPKIRARVPDATLEIAGVGLATDPRGRPIVPDAWKVPGITTLGFLEDLERLYARSVALLAPVIGGSGVRVKLLEGMRAGIPVVTTHDGAFGLPITDGEEALVASDADELAERVERLVRDDLLRDRIREGGYAYLEKFHSLSLAQAMMRRALGLAALSPPRVVPNVASPLESRQRDGRTVDRERRDVGGHLPPQR
jgi:glycosyltransferase involved in cell wall biosynthesis